MEFRPYYLAREWVKLGYKVTIIAADFSHLRQKNIDIQKARYYEQNIDGINYIWVKTCKYKANGIKRLFSMFLFLRNIWQIKYKLVRDLKPDLVISSSTYPFDTFIGHKIAKLAQAKFIYEIHDLWPLTLIELEGMPKYHPLIWLMQLAEDFGYKHADRVVSLLPKAREYMVEHGMLPLKFVHIPNGIDVDEATMNVDVIPNEHQNIITQVRNQFKFIVGYAGGMGKSNALDDLIDVAASLPEFGFVLVGGGLEKDRLINKLSAKNLKNIHFLPQILKHQVQAFLSQMDALYMGWNKLSIYRFGVCPNKLFDYMLAKKPIIYAVSAGNDMVSDANCGISVDAGNLEEIKSAIIKMSTLTSKERQVMGEHGYSYVVKYHDYKVLSHKFIHSV